MAATSSALSVLDLLSVRVVFCALIISVACTDTSAPIKPPVAASLTAEPTVSVTGTVGTKVENPPAVLVVDGSGKRMSGVLVEFRVTRGDGSLTGASATSDASGVARVESWTLGKLSGVQAVTATKGILSTSFAVIANAGPPSAFEKISGDGQVAPHGSPVPAPLQVRVRDQYENPVPAIVVRFAVQSGGGSLTGESVSTDSNGVATLARWTLGELSEQSISATIASFDPLIFTARAIETPAKCGSPSTLIGDAKIASELTATACQTYDGRFFEMYLVTLPTAGTWDFKVASTEFATRLELEDASGTPIATNRKHNETNSDIKAILPAGAVYLLVSSENPFATGHYSVSYSASATDAAGCEIAIARGISTNGTGEPGACTPTGEAATDLYRIYMRAGSIVTAKLEDYSLSTNHFEMQNDNGSTVASAVAKDYVESDLAFTAPADGYYIILVQVEYRYLLTVQ